MYADVGRQRRMARKPGHNTSEIRIGVLSREGVILSQSRETRGEPRVALGDTHDKADCTRLRR
jgi:hypothetical protein